MTADLFDAPLIPGLRTMTDLISEAEEEALIARIFEQPLTPFQFGAFEGKRLTQSFGCHYDFSTHRLVEAEPIPDWLQPLRESAAALAGLPVGALRHILLIRYDPGAGIGWHKDRPQFDHVIGISLGAEAELTFRRRLPDRRFERRRLPLPPRSAYHLTGPARHEWEHGIAAHRALRFSITFRSLREELP